MTAAGNSFTLSVRHFDLARSMALQRVGRFDPTASSEDRRFIKIHQDREGTATRTTLSQKAGELDVRVEGPAASSVTAAWRRHLATLEEVDDFVPRHPRLRRFADRFPGVRVVRVPWLFDVAISAVLQQRVRFADAVAAYGRIAKRLGTDSGVGRVQPTPATLARTPAHVLESLGVDRKRARALIDLAREETFRGFLTADASFAHLRKHLRAIRGIGPWTTEMILGFGAGDPDAVPTGDLHLPRVVVTALAGRGPFSDAHMLKLLEPFDGHRFRVIRLIWAASFGGAPKRPVII